MPSAMRKRNRGYDLLVENLMSDAWIYDHGKQFRLKKMSRITERADDELRNIIDCVTEEGRAYRFIGKITEKPLALLAEHIVPLRPDEMDSTSVRQRRLGGDAGSAVERLRCAGAQNRLTMLVEASAVDESAGSARRH